MAGVRTTGDGDGDIGAAPFRPVAITPITSKKKAPERLAAAAIRTPAAKREHTSRRSATPTTSAPVARTDLQVRDGPLQEELVSVFRSDVKQSGKRVA